MTWFGTIAAEILGLFVDDGAFALAIVAWIVLTWLVLPRLGAPSGAQGLILFVGLASILIGSAIRAAGR